MEPPIVIENLSKQYKRGEAKASYTALRDVLMLPFQKKSMTQKQIFFGHFITSIWKLIKVNGWELLEATEPVKAPY